MNVGSHPPRGGADFVWLRITKRAGAVCAKRICAAVAKRHGVRARKCSACRTRSLRSSDHILSNYLPLTDNNLAASGRVIHQINIGAAVFISSLSTFIFGLRNVKPRSAPHKATPDASKNVLSKADTAAFIGLW